MPQGKIDKIVHLTLQSANSSDCSPQPKGYGFVVPDQVGAGADRYYFEPKALQGYSLDDLQVGQPVDFEPDAKLPVAKSVKPLGEVLAPAPPQLDLP